MWSLLSIVATTHTPKDDLEMQCYKDIGNNLDKRNTVFAVPIVQVLRDLSRYHQEGKLDGDEPSLKALARIGLQEPLKPTIKIISYKDVLTTAPELVNRDDVTAKFNFEFDKIRIAYIGAIPTSATIKRFLYKDIPLENNYIPLCLDIGEKKNVEATELLPSPNDNEPWRLLVVGDPGMGKTTLSLYWINEWAKQSNALYTQFEWVFRIELRNLMRENVYPNDPKKNIRLAEILVQECFEQGVNLTPTAQEMYQRYRSLWYDTLEGIVNGTVLKNNKPVKALLILDGLDELTIPSHLEDVFKKLIKCPYVIVTSRNSNLQARLDQAGLLQIEQHRQQAL